jgi:hypothetical protein
MAHYFQKIRWEVKKYLSCYHMSGFVIFRLRFSAAAAIDAHCTAGEEASPLARLTSLTGPNEETQAALDDLLLAASRQVLLNSGSPTPSVLRHHVLRGANLDPVKAVSARRAIFLRDAILCLE